MTAVHFAPRALEILAAEPRLRARIEQALTSIVEAAVDMQAARGLKPLFQLDPERALTLRMGPFSIAYVLRLDRSAAAVIDVWRENGSDRKSRAA
jgi:hypothetical protein